MAYTTEQYEGSEAYKCTMGATREQLEIRKRYTEMAVEYHAREENTDQTKFFMDDLALINKRLSLKSTA